MAHILSYASGAVGYGLSNNLDEAMAEAEDRCTEMQQPATIIDRSTYLVLAEVKFSNGRYRATAKE